MKKIVIILFAIVALTIVSIMACNSSSSPSDRTEGIAEIHGAISQDSLVNRGRYLVTIMGCNDCHSSKIMGPHGPVIDTVNMLGGHLASMNLSPAPLEAVQSWILFNPTLTAFVGPWGTTFAANISSDETGIGNWTEAQFFKAIREGKYKGMDNTRPLLPPMPWEMYRHTSDEDLRSIFAYLKSTPPVRNVVPSPIPPDRISKL